MIKLQLNKILCEVTHRERMVILLRFGLEDRQARTLEEVGKEFNVSESGSVRLKLRCYSSCAIPAEAEN